MSIKPSIYSTATIESSDGRTVDFRVGCAAIDYYEDLLSPALSLKIQVVNSSGAIRDDKGVKTSIYEGLKIRGGEKVTLRIEPNSGTNIPLDFINKPLFVMGVKNVLRDAKREFFTLHLVTREAVENEVTFLQKAYSKDAKISDHVRNILSESFQDAAINQIDDTSNNLGFIGNQMKPFLALVRLASQSVPDISKEATAGFFFWQTSEGYNFRSIDKMMTADIKARYVYSEVAVNMETFNPIPDLQSVDFKIMNFQVLKNQDILKSLAKGSYATEKRYFDPVTFKLTNPDDNYDGSDYIGRAKNLGVRFDPTDLELADGSVKFTNSPSQIITDVEDIGTVTKGVSKEKTKDIDKYLTQRKMRYNTLFTQVIYIQVPYNSNLHAGDIIDCRFPKITDGAVDDIDTGQISGFYMIRELNHHFDPNGSFTSMQIVRDTYGLYGANR